MNRNLLLCKRKPPGEAVCSKVKSVGELLNPVTGFTRPPLPKLFFQCSRSQASTSRPLNLSSRALLLLMAAASGVLSCLSGLDSS